MVAAVAAVGSGCGTGGTTRVPPPFVAPRMPHVLPAEPSILKSDVADREFVARASALAAQDDIGGAVRVLESIADEAQRVRVAIAFLADLVERNLRTAAAVAEAMSPGPAQNAAMEAVGRILARREPEAALRWAIAILPSTARRAAVQTVIRELMTGEPRLTVERILALPRGLDRDEAVAIAATQWVQRDASTAVGWLRERPDDQIKPLLTSSFGFALAQVAPSQAIAVADMLPPGRDRWLLLSAIGETWVAKDLTGALAWARQFPVGDARDAALAGIESGLGGPTSRRTSAMATAGSTFGSGGRFESGATADGGGPGRGDAVADRVRRLSVENPAGAAQWIAGLPAGSERDQAIAAYAEQVLRNPPAIAADQVSLLPPSDLRDRMTEELARQWLLTNPAAAEAWLLGTSLPPDRKAWLLRAAGR